jgi:hypothetical protein
VIRLERFAQRDVDVLQVNDLWLANSNFRQNSGVSVYSTMSNARCVQILELFGIIVAMERHDVSALSTKRESDPLLFATPWRIE